MGSVLVGCFFGIGDHADLPLAFEESDLAIGEGKQCPIAPDADIRAGRKFAATLADDDAAGVNPFTVAAFDTEALILAVAPVPCAALTFFMCHKSMP